MIGVQWHPEAFNPSDNSAVPHKGIFEALKVAGTTYKNRKRLNKEFIKALKKNVHGNCVFFKPKNKDNQPDMQKELEEEMKSMKIDGR